MSVWVLHQSLSLHEENEITKRNWLELPFGDLPDLRVYQHGELKKLFEERYPESPPETHMNMADRTWVRMQLERDDILAVPLHARQEVMMGVVSTPYRYENGKHLIGVEWQDVSIPKLRFGKAYSSIFERGNEPMFEITNAEERNAIRRWLPNSYNRFAGWKWFLVAFMILEAIMFAMQGF
jgi:predicted Mrr-cat superfamily restriction endonuclease